MPDVPGITIRWHLLTPERVGLRNLRFGDRTLDLVAWERESPQKPVTLSISSTGDFHLELTTDYGSYSKTISPGDHQITFGEESD